MSSQFIEALISAKISRKPLGIEGKKVRNCTRSKVYNNPILARRILICQTVILIQVIKNLKNDPLIFFWHV